MTERLPADQEAREAALDPGRSFIVQAPAGSGKTELLTRRFLRLLALVDQPEEVLAITFTRKAAGEMRDRILEALVLAESDSPPQDGHKRRTWELARAARARDLALQWDLSDSPRRLRVETIDALNAWLARQLPVSSGIGTAPAPAEDPEPAYRAAARRVLKAAGTDHPAGEPARALLAHLGNRFDQAETLLVELLARRDHWLRRVVGRGRPGDEERVLLEQAVANFVQKELERVRGALPEDVRAELGAIAPRAAARAPGMEVLAPLEALSGFPAADAGALPAWRAIAELLLTKVGKWRKTVSVAQGFGTDAQEDKARMLAVLESLAALEDLAVEMQRVRRLPDPEYGPERWAILSHLLRLLPLAAAELGLEFAARGETDFVGVAQAALDAVGSPDAPTDLALALDYRIRHILVDEFQDTSQAQVDLLERLTAGWEPGDGRTLFCVGDPMQSIYRFREADVGRFLKARRDGIGEVPLEPLRLSVNFRSRDGLVHWVSGTFGPMFPEREDLQLGAVPFSASEPWRTAGPTPAVTCTAVAPSDRQGEARAVAARVVQIRRDAPDARIAVLARGRPHLADIGPALTKAGVRYQAVEVQSLASAPVVQDLMALTRALLHRGDRAAWLSVLRAPWCGVTLPALTVLAGDPRADVWDRVTDPGVRAQIDALHRERVERFAAALAPALELRGRRPLRRLVYAAWLALGGGATARSPTDLVDATRFFEFLEVHDAGGDLDDPAALETLAGDLYAAPDVEAGDTVQLMTVHKAKGLEFDHVLLPGLDRGVGGDRGGLLRWLEQVGPDGPELIFAPVEPIGEDKDALHAALRDLDARRDALEQDRLLYVATTRAREQLHLFAAVGEDDPETGVPPEPRKGTPLARLWPAVADAFLAGRPEDSPRPAEVNEPGVQSLRRLASDWRPPPPAEAPAWEHRASADPAGRAPVEYDWAGRAGRAVGIAVHRMLEVIAREGPDAWPDGRVEGARTRVRVLLAEAGVPPAGLDGLTLQSLEALRATLADPRGRWILDPGHAEACSERRVSGFVEGVLVAGVVDRSFVDDEGTLWIVDFKAGRHEGAGLEAFLDREQARYRPQLERYAALLAPLHAGPVRLGLYFPRHAEWRAWTPGGEPGGAA